MSLSWEEDLEIIVIVICVCVVLLFVLSFATWRWSFLTRIRLCITHRLGLRGRGAVPIYWENADKDLRRAQMPDDVDYFNESRDLQDIRALQALMNKTSCDEDKGFRVVRAVRIENSPVWSRYQKKASKVAKWRGKCSFAGKGPPLTTRACADMDKKLGFDTCLTDALDPGICEVYLWHATKPEVAASITKTGFDVTHASKAGKRFGTGGYFSEDPSKADEYAVAGEGTDNERYAMLLCRVILGKQYRIDTFRAEDATAKARWLKAHDSTLAEPKGAKCREFIAFKAEQIYPEYSLVYERVHPSCLTDDELEESCESSEDV